MKRVLWLAMSCFGVLAAGPQALAASNDLPDIGSEAQATLSLDDEYRIGRMIVRGLQDSDRILQDPEVTEYLQGLGHRLSGQTTDGNGRFEFFVVKDSGINAFALPGGFIGVNTGLLLATKDEAELAGVLAHEISHVTQRHIARSLAAQSKSSLVSTAAMLAAILIGAAVGGGGDAAMAGIAAAQTVALQQQTSFTRDNEAEADRVGIGLLARAGFDPNGMPDFFETIGRRYGAGEDRIPEILRTHPVTSERIAESRSRAAQLDVTPSPDSASYALTRERIRVLTTPVGQDPHQYYASIMQNEADVSNADRYGNALSLLVSNHAAEAIPLLQKMRDSHQTVVQYHIALGQAQLEAGQGQKAVATLARARELFPRNIPVTIRYAEALLRTGDARRAHEVLLDLFNNVAPTPEQARFIAMAANSAGDAADAYSYMAEYHVMGGDFPLAINQLQLALSVPKITEVQRQRFKARLEELQRAMPRRNPTRQASSDRLR